MVNTIFIQKIRVYYKQAQDRTHWLNTQQFTKPYSTFLLV